MKSASRGEQMEEGGKPAGKVVFGQAMGLFFGGVGRGVAAFLSVVGRVAEDGIVEGQ